MSSRITFVSESCFWWLIGVSQRDGPRGPYPGGPPAQYGPGGYGGYPGPQQAQQPPQQQENGGGFWSKLKNTVQIFTGMCPGLRM